MANLYLHCFSNILLLVFIMNLIIVAADEDRQVYIVYMGNTDDTNKSPSLDHLNILQEVADNRFARPSLLRSYTRTFNAFAAYLTPREQEKLASHDKVVSIFPNTIFHPQTTRSWDFMGFSMNAHRNLMVESDIIIGVIDSGIWPESLSFNDEGFSPPPTKWKGACEGGMNFTCNNKVIGARYYNPFDDSARDTGGHGSHTASVAAGYYVNDASFYGIASGTARGGVPLSRIAVYKVCNPSGCETSDILGAFDDAIADGVDIITISLGGGGATDLINDPISIGALHASQKGVLVVQPVGNDMLEKTICSVAPWIFSVTASSIDRGIITKVVLGDGTILSGKSVNSVSLNGTSFSLVYEEDVSQKCGKPVQFCALEPSLVKGKVLLCTMSSCIEEVSKFGALGAIAPTGDMPDVSFVVPIPSSRLHEHEFNVVKHYISSKKYHNVQILTSETIRNLDAPHVASFSSRGPNIIIPDILKPDVTAPGVEILAAYSPLASPSEEPYDQRRVNYNIISGTSMACPHVAGAAAYIKSLHPNWSPSAIKSALMTTSWRMDSTKDALAEFSYGAGHIDPTHAADPGLVYETSLYDYSKLLCCLGYDTTQVRNIFGVNIICPTGMQMSPKDLNYPSMSIRINTNVTSFSERFTRTVTNVGPEGHSTYKVTTSKDRDYEIIVKPDILTFESLYEVKSFEVIIKGKMNSGNMVSASLEWSDGIHVVRSPIIVYSNSTKIHVQGLHPSSSSALINAIGTCIFLYIGSQLCLGAICGRISTRW